MVPRIRHRFWCPEPRLVGERDLPVDALLDLPRTVFDPRDCCPSFFERPSGEDGGPGCGPEAQTENVC